ncbi:MAG: hypothetical protein KA314_17280 [Chloroflexi bacterium]|nr:hypothetical protein [Chloroflexota bacterium]MBP8057587.1 hypothetical protein [Chloroflexota bacterium]
MSVIQGKGPTTGKQYWWRSEAGEKKVCAPRPGSICQQCQKGKLAYDSLFNLSCPVCGRVASAGAFT